MYKILDNENPLLRQISEEVDHSAFGEPWLKELADNLLAIMKETSAVGVAAPQVGIHKRIIVFGTAYTKTRKVELEIPNTVLINPCYKVLSDEKQIDYEGCLNVPETCALVPRAMEIEYSGYYLDGTSVTVQARGLEARILQHEIDHLDGILFLDRIEDPSSLT